MVYIDAQIVLLVFFSEQKADTWIQEISSTSLSHTCLV